MITRFLFIYLYIMPSTEHNTMSTVQCINQIYLQETDDENIKKIYLDKIKGINAFTGPEIGIERVRNEYHAYLVNLHRCDSPIKT